MTMEAVVKELQHDAQLGVFFAPDCNVSAIASEIVGRDAAAVTSKQRASSSTVDDAFELGGQASSHSERFILRIDDAVRKIDRVITDHIGDNHSALLDQVGSADDLQRHVTAVQTSVAHLRVATADLEAVVKAQHAKLHASIEKQRNVDKCSEILRRLLRFSQLSERVLGSSLSVVTGTRSRAASTDHGTSVSSSDVTTELVTLALAIREIESLTVDPQFEDLSVVRASLPTLRRIGVTMRRDVRASLRTGMHRLSQADVGDALQILWYLGALSESVQTAVNDVIQDVERKCASAIAEEMLVRVSAGASNGTGTSATEATAQKADVWKAIQDVFDVVRVHALEVWTLQRVLGKMRDASSGQSYLDLVLEPDEPTLFATFWDVTCAIVRELFAATLQYRPAVKLVLIASYPRMRDEATRVLNDLYAATHYKTDGALLSDASTPVAAAGPAGGPRGRASSSAKSARDAALRGIAGSAVERNQLLDSMAPLLDVFTDRTYRRMANPIQLMFPQSSNFHTSPPGRSDMQTLARTIFAEVDHAGHDSVLLDAVLQQIRRAVQLFCGHVKRIMNTGKAATTTSPTYGRTPAQAHNVGLMNVLHQLDDALDDVVARVKAAATTSSAPSSPSVAIDDSSNSVKTVETLVANELGPCRELIQGLEYTLLGTYLQSLSAVLESIFAKMHDESFADQPPQSQQQQSQPQQQQQQRASLDRSGSSNTTAQPSGSKYMAEFNSAFHVVLDEHIKRLPNAPFAGQCVSDFVARVISVFVRHASLLRPLEERGKLRLAHDMAQLELRLEHIVPLKTLGAPYDELRAFRHMMFLESASVLRDSTIDRIRPSNVWHHLLARAPVELQLPHHMKRWSAAKYVHWLDTAAGFENRASPGAKSPDALSVTTLPLGYPCLKDRRTALHAEKEAWKEIVQCLDAYAQRVSATTDVTISPIYETLLEAGSILLAGYEVSLMR